MKLTRLHRGYAYVFAIQSVVESPYLLGFEHTLKLCPTVCYAIGVVVWSNFSTSRVRVRVIVCAYACVK